MDLPLRRRAPYRSLMSPHQSRRLPTIRLPLVLLVAFAATLAGLVYLSQARQERAVAKAQLIIGIGGVLLSLTGVGIALLGGLGLTLPLERRIAEGDARFRIMADTVPSILFTTDQDGACEYISERFYDYTGMAPGTAKGLGWMAAIHPEDRARILRVLADRPSVGRPSDLELRVRAGGGAYRWFAVRTSEVDRATGNGLRRFGTATDIDDLKRTETTLHQLSTQLMRSQDDERRRIAREIHDTTIQNLVAVKMQIDQVRDGVIPGAVLAATALDEARDLLVQSLSELRTLSYLLHPPMLDELGLASAIRWYAQGFEKRSGIAVSVDAPETMCRLPADTETALFRVIQEGLANIHRHSGSREARVALTQHRERIELEIADKGRGMPNPACSDGCYLGVGIPGMRVRIQQIGGRFELKSSGDGTTLRAVVPQIGPLVAKSETVTTAARRAPWGLDRQIQVRRDQRCAMHSSS